MVKDSDKWIHMVKGRIISKVWEFPMIHGTSHRAIEIIFSENNIEK